MGSRTVADPSPHGPPSWARGAAQSKAWSCLPPACQGTYTPKSQTTGAVRHLGCLVDGRRAHRTLHGYVTRLCDRYELRKYVRWRPCMVDIVGRLGL